MLGIREVINRPTRFGRLGLRRTAAALSDETVLCRCFDAFDCHCYHLCTFTNQTTLELNMLSTFRRVCARIIKFTSLITAQNRIAPHSTRITCGNIGTTIDSMYIQTGIPNHTV
jgi:hypothetical protein